MVVTMCTSGVGLNRERLQRLAEAGLAVLILGLDSLEAATHDGNRGVEGLHARVLAAALEARARGLEVLFNTVATREKLASGEIARLAELAADHGATLNLTVPTPQGRWMEKDVVLDAFDRARLDAALRHPNVRTDVDSAYGRKGCPAGVEKLSVDPYGNVRACPLLPGIWGTRGRNPFRRFGPACASTRASARAKRSARRRVRNSGSATPICSERYSRRRASYARSSGLSAVPAASASWRARFSTSVRIAS
jgi:MoaA/NifB/PqqE/SkfB family radical SAM enzyme